MLAHRFRARHSFTRAVSLLRPLGNWRSLQESRRWPTESAATVNESGNGDSEVSARLPTGGGADLGLGLLAIEVVAPRCHEAFGVDLDNGGPVHRYRRAGAG
jgi:hypothetical protein